MSDRRHRQFSSPKSVEHLWHNSHVLHKGSLKHLHMWHQKSWVQMLALPFVIWVALGEFLDFQTSVSFSVKMRTVIHFPLKKVCVCMNVCTRDSNEILYVKTLVTAVCEILLILCKDKQDPTPISQLSFKNGFKIFLNLCVCVCEYSVCVYGMYTEARGEHLFFTSWSCRQL